MALSKTAARRLVNQAKGAFGTLEEVLPKIIEGEAWLALGYADVYEFWRAEFSDYRLATEAARVELVYAMFRAGKDDVETAVAVKGVGGEGVKARRRQFNSGFTPEEAEAAGFKVHVLSGPEPKTRTVVVGPYSHEEYDTLEKAAHAAGSTVAKEARKAIDAWFAQLGAAQAA